MGSFLVNVRGSLAATSEGSLLSLQCSGAFFLVVVGDSSIFATE